MKRATLVLAALALLLGSVGQARAGIIININQVGADVVATGSGSIDLTGLTLQIPAITGPQIQANVDDLIMGTKVIGIVDFYAGAMGPGNFGPGTPRFVSPTSGSGDLFGLHHSALTGPTVLGVILPTGYVSGTSLSAATDTYSGQTFSSLGLTPGTYTYTWDGGGPTHTLTVQIGPATTTTPEPSTLTLLSLGSLSLLGYSWRRRKHAVA
jgi:hypothetical protein